jgi:ribosomal-protein-alanine N-acetyltransferase
LNTLSSKRLYFINPTPDIVNKILEGRMALGEYLHLSVPEEWDEFETAPFAFVKERLQIHPDEAPWWLWLAVLSGENLLIGQCGYKGPPNDGMVEFGYGVVTSYRGIGLATEIAAVLIDHAFSFPEITHVLAHTLPEENASTHILRKCGLHFVKEVMDPEDGLIWQWKLNREDF